MALGHLGREGPALSSREGDGARAFTNVILDAKKKEAWYREGVEKLANQEELPSEESLATSAARQDAWSKVTHQAYPL